MTKWRPIVDKIAHMGGYSVTCTGTARRQIFYDNVVLVTQNLTQDITRKSDTRRIPPWAGYLLLKHSYEKECWIMIIKQWGNLKFKPN